MALDPKQVVLTCHALKQIAFREGLSPMLDFMDSYINGYNKSFTPVSDNEQVEMIREITKYGR